MSSWWRTGPLKKRPKVGDRIRFQMPIEGVETGTIKNVDGSYTLIETDFKYRNKKVLIERYWESEVELFET